MPSMVEVLGCPMGSRHLSLLGEYWEMNSTAVSPCWHRVSRGWWMLSPSLLPLWWRAVGQGAAGAPRSKPRGPEQRRRCGSLQEVMKAVFPFPTMPASTPVGTWWGGHPQTRPGPFSLPTGTGPKGEKGEKGERGLKGDSGTGGIVGMGSVKGEKVGERVDPGGSRMPVTVTVFAFHTFSSLFLSCRGRKENWALR